jgi:thioredoxin 1
MENKENDELERIKRAKLRKMLKKSEVSAKEKRVISEPLEVTDATFKEIVQNHSLVVVDCWAPWCFPCRMVAPVIEELSRDYAGKILFGKLNVDENPEVSAQYEIMSIPTLLVIKNGKLVDRIVGAVPRRMLEQQITCYL